MEPRQKLTIEQIAVVLTANAGIDIPGDMHHIYPICLRIIRDGAGWVNVSDRRAVQRWYEEAAR